jgi:DNA-binding CsgD family transcriptional regulator
VIRLDVHDGTHRRTLAVEADPVRVGRDGECEVPLPGDTTVSRVHALLTSTPDGWQVADAGSRNGTFVNGRKLLVPQLLSLGDRILIGNFVLVLQADDAALIETVGVDDASAARVQVETGLSPRELEVLRLVSAGDSDQQIAATLFISVKTVHSHLDRIRTKTGCRRRAELLRYAMDHGVA